MSDTIKRFTRYIEIEKNLSKHTVKAYLSDIDQFNTYLNNTISLSVKNEEHINQIQKHHVRLWIAELSHQGLSKTSLARKIAAVRSFFKFNVKRGVISTNPLSTIITPRKSKKLPETVSKSDIEYLFSIIETEHTWGKQERLIFELLYGTGIRLSELVNINIDDISLKRNQIRIIGKGDKERIVPYGSNAKEALTIWLNNRDEYSNPNSGQALLLTQKGKRIYPRLVQRIVEKYLVKASEVTKKSPHILRHSFATHLLDNGAELNAIKELLGHANLAATQIYTSTSVERLKQIYKQAHPRAENNQP